jgi:hypothetical protein
VKIFDRFMMRSTLSEIVVGVLLVNKDNGSYKKYMAPEKDGEVQY